MKTRLDAIALLSMGLELDALVPELLCKVLVLDDLALPYRGDGAVDTYSPVLKDYPATGLSDWYVCGDKLSVLL